MLAPQSVSPALHELEHAADEHVVLPPAGGTHVRPHVPQLAALVLRLVSQPFATFPSQSPKPALQRRTHALLEHVAV